MLQTYSSAIQSLMTAVNNINEFGQVLIFKLILALTVNMLWASGSVIEQQHVNN